MTFSFILTGRSARKIVLTGLWGMGLLIYAQSISEKNLHRALSFIHSKIIQHILTVVLDGLGIGCLGFLTIIYPNRFWQWKWTRNEFGFQNYMGACSPGSLCHTQTETDGDILYLALLLLLGGDATQFFCEGW